MHPQTVYAKTSKGVLEIKNKAVKLDRDSGNVFLSVDGKSTVAELVAKDKLEIKAVESILNELTKSGFIKVFSTPAERPAAAKPAGPATPAHARLRRHLQLKRRWTSISPHPRPLPKSTLKPNHAS